MIKRGTFQRISFHYLTGPFYFSHRKDIKNAIELLFKSEGARFESLSYIFCSDEYMLGINQSFLQHDYYTDIITFNLAETGNPAVGEIYISVDRVRDNAAELRESFRRELVRVILHGALHLCGYKDKKSRDRKVMRQKEDYYLRKALG